MLIKKYPNRLYDVTNSAYITLDDLASLLRKHDDIKVVDAKTGDDITQITLLQVLIEQQQKGISQSILPNGFLLQLIRMQSETCNKSFAAYIDMAMDFFSQNTINIESMMNTNPLGAMQAHWQKILLKGVKGYVDVMSGNKGKDDI